MELGAGEDRWGAGLGHGCEKKPGEMAGVGWGGWWGGGPGAGRGSPGLTLRAVPRVVTALPYGAWGLPALRFGSSPEWFHRPRPISKSVVGHSVLGARGPAVERGLLPGPATQACACGPSSGGHQLSQPCVLVPKASPRSHSLQRAASPSERSPQLSPPRHTAGGAPHKPRVPQRWCSQGQCALEAGGRVNPSPAPRPWAGPLTRASC